jgi:hypothetical protein
MASRNMAARAGEWWRERARGGFGRVVSRDHVAEEGEGARHRATALTARGGGG